MLQELISQHAGDIMNLLGNKYGLNTQQASTATNSITAAIGNFLSAELQSGKLDMNHIVDLFNKNTPNQSNSLFSGLSNTVSQSLSNSGLAQNAISQISTHGLNDIIGIIQSGKLGGIDMNTVTKIAGMLTGKGGGGMGDLLGGLTGLFGNK